MPQRVFVDASVLFSQTTRDWLYFLRIFNEGMFQIHSTEDVLAEAAARLRDHKPRATGEQAMRWQDKMRRCLDEIVESFPGDTPFSGSDDGDYHVHAAAVASGADVLLTCDRPDNFTAGSERYEVLSPDEFFLLVVKSNPRCLQPIIEEQIQYWARRPRHLQLDDALRSAGCTVFAGRVKEELKRMARTPS